jgi:hypothetical protein
MIKGVGELTHFITRLDGNGLIEIPLGRPLCGSQQFIDRAIDESSEEEAQEKSEDDDADNPRQDHSIVDLHPLLFKPFQANHGVEHPEDVLGLWVAGVTGGFVIDGIDQAQKALIIGVVDSRLTVRRKKDFGLIFPMAPVASLSLLIHDGSNLGPI